MALTSLDMMKEWVEYLTVKNRAQDEEIKFLKLTIVSLNQELEVERNRNRNSNGRNSVNNVETQVDEVNLSPGHNRGNVQSQSDVNINSGHQNPRATTSTGSESLRGEELETNETMSTKSTENLPRKMLRRVMSESDLRRCQQIPITVHQLQIEETRENSGMIGSFTAMTAEDSDSSFHGIRMEGEPVDELNPANLQTETPSMDEDIDIKDEDVDYGHVPPPRPKESEAQTIPPPKPDRMEKATSPPPPPPPPKASGVQTSPPPQRDTTTKATSPPPPPTELSVQTTPPPQEVAVPVPETEHDDFDPEGDIPSPLTPTDVEHALAAVVQPAPVVTAQPSPPEVETSPPPKRVTRSKGKVPPVVIAVESSGPADASAKPKKTDIPPLPPQPPQTQEEQPPRPKKKGGKNWPPPPPPPPQVTEEQPPKPKKKGGKTGPPSEPLKVRSQSKNTVDPAYYSQQGPASPEEDKDNDDKFFDFEGERLRKRHVGNQSTNPLTKKWFEVLPSNIQEEIDGTSVSHYYDTFELYQKMNKKLLGLYRVQTALACAICTHQGIIKEIKVRKIRPAPGEEELEQGSSDRKPTRRKKKLEDIPVDPGFHPYNRPHDLRKHWDRLHQRAVKCLICGKVEASGRMMAAHMAKMAVAPNAQHLDAQGKKPSSSSSKKSTRRSKRTIELVEPEPSSESEGEPEEEDGEDKSVHKKRRQ